MKNFKTIPIAAALGCLLAVNVFALTDQEGKKRAPKNDNTVIIKEDKKRPPSDDKKEEREKKPEKKPSAQMSFPFNFFSSLPS